MGSAPAAEPILMCALSD